MPTCTAGSTTTTHYGFCKPADGETGWGTAYRTTMDAIDSAIFNTGTPRSYLAGLQTTPTVASTSVSIAVGVAMGNDQATSITLTSPLVKVLSSSWTVGSGNGGLYAATAIQGLQTYHLMMIIRTDTNVVDAYYDTAVNATNIPSPYTVYRRIASFRTDSSKNIVGWTQDNDAFVLTAPSLDVNDTNPGTSAVSKALASIATGVNLNVTLNAYLTLGAASASRLYVSDLASNDLAPSGTVTPLCQLRVTANNEGGGQVAIRTNTSGQIRYRVDFSDANTTVKMVPTSYLDTRGKGA